MPKINSIPSVRFNAWISDRDGNNRLPFRRFVTSAKTFYVSFFVFVDFVALTATNIDVSKLSIF